MPHKFKIGTTVSYNPKDRMLSPAPARTILHDSCLRWRASSPEYRIKHFSEEFERVAFESELSAE